MSGLIDVVVKRGAIQANEMVGVGVLFNKINKLILDYN
jgi:hypothetical protein